jgi:hypothetical protein
MKIDLLINDIVVDLENEDVLIDQYDENYFETDL